MVRKQWVVMLGLALVVATTACTSTMTPLNDAEQAAIEAKIRAEIATHYPGETFDIHIDVTDAGVVTLGGTVDDNDKRVRIDKIARETGNVRRVINNIAVKE